jgi:hypothetical protein
MIYGGLSVPIGEVFGGLATDRGERSLRLALLHGEAIRVPKAAARMRVLSGKAWVTFNGEDVLLGSGEGLALPSKPRYAPVVSAVGEEPLFFEMD